MGKFLSNFMRLGENRRRKLVVLFVGLLSAYTLFGFYALPALLKHALLKNIPSALHRQVSIERVWFNPYTLKLTLQGFDLAKREGRGQLVRFDELVVNVQLASLYKRALIVKSLALRGPQVDFSRTADGLYSFSDLLTGANQEQGQTDEPSRPFLFSLNNIVIKGGAIRFDDQPKATVHQVEALQVAIPTLSNLPYHIETYVQPAFSALINGTQLDLGGMVKPFADSQETLVDIKMAGIDIPSYLAYIPAQGGLTLRSALVDLDLKLAFGNFPQQGPKLALTGQVVVRELEMVDDQDHSYLRLPRLTLEFADSNLLAKEVHLKKVSLVQPELEFWRQPDGSLLPLSLLAGSSDSATTSAPVQPSADQNDFVLVSDLFELQTAAVIFHDMALASGKEAMLGMGSLNVELSDFSTVEDTVADFRFDLLINEAGKLKGKGQFGVSPLTAQVSYELEELALLPFQPYVQERLQVVLAGGAFNSKGSVSLATDEGQLRSTFQGQASLVKLAMVDSSKGEDLLGWQGLFIKDIDFSSQPQSLQVGEVLLEGMAAKLVINDDGSSNIATLPVAGRVEEGAAGQDATVVQKEGNQAEVAIKQVKLVDGRLDFVDRKVRPSYAATLADINGTVSGLSSQPSSQAVVDIRAKFNRHAPLVVSGKVNPLQEKLFVDLQVDFSDLDLSHTSPYTGTYLGYKTEKGKLNFDLHYLVDDRDLTGMNNLFLDQFTLGETVDSPDDLGLPISLAVALLKNRKGEIRLDLPVAGNLDDPEFSVGGVVFQVFVNLIAKAATSPFALLGALVPEGEDLQKIQFQPGLAQISPESQEKLDQIAYVLFERPGLKMDIRGAVEPAVDRPALAQQILMRMLKLQKLQASKQGAAENKREEEVQLSTEEYERYLRRLFTLRLRASGAKPVPMPQTMAEIESYVLSDIKVADEQLRLLAVERANQALHYLTQQGDIAAERLFVVEPQVQVEDATDSGTLVHLLIK